MKLLLVLLLVVGVASEAKFTRKEATKLVKVYRETKINHELSESDVYELLLKLRENTFRVSKFTALIDLYRVDAQWRCDTTTLSERVATLHLVASELQAQPMDRDKAASLRDYLEGCEGRLLKHCMAQDSKMTLDFIYKDAENHRQALAEFFVSVDERNVYRMIADLKFKDIFDLYANFMKRRGFQLKSGSSLGGQMIQAFEFNWSKFRIMQKRSVEWLFPTEDNNLEFVRLHLAYLIYQKLRSQTSSKISFFPFLHGSVVLDFLQNLARKLTNENCVELSEKSLHKIVDKQLAFGGNAQMVEQQLREKLQKSCEPADEESKSLLRLVWVGLWSDFNSDNQLLTKRIWSMDAFQACGCRFASRGYVEPIIYSGRQLD